MTRMTEPAPASDGPAEGTAVVWFRRDLRVRDQATFLAAADAARRGLALFVLDPALLGPSGAPRRTVLYRCLRALDESLRQIAHSIRSTTAVARPVVDAVESELRALETATGIEVGMQVEGDLCDLSDSQKIVLFRVVQESLSNVRKHSEAARVSVVLRSRRTFVELTVTDDGRTLLDRADAGKARLDRFARRHQNPRPFSNLPRGPTGDLRHLASLATLVPSGDRCARRRRRAVHRRRGGAFGV